MRKLAGSPKDPLAAPAATKSLELLGEDAVAIAEETLLQVEHPGPGLISSLTPFPSERLLERVVALGVEEQYYWECQSYLSALGTPKATRERERLKSAQGEPLTLIIDWPSSGLADGRERSVDQLKKLLADHDAGRPERLMEQEKIRICGMGLRHDTTGEDVLRALAAKRDPTLLPILLERLEDPEHSLQLAAIRALQELRATEAAPALRRLARSSNLGCRGPAIGALGVLGTPGTADFLRSILRDNPTTVPAALARMGVDARSDLRRLIDDSSHPGPLLGALDLMENPEVFRNIDRVMPSRPRGPWNRYPAVLEATLGVPVRYTAEAGRNMPCAPTNLCSVRASLEALDGTATTLPSRWTHLTRNGVVEICGVDEAKEHWRRH